MRFKGDLEKDNIGKLLLTLSLPAMIGMTVNALYNVVDTFWVGKLGPEAIAALTIVFPIQMIMVAIASGTGIGLTSLISRRLGEGRKNDASNIAEHGILLIIIYGLIIPILAIPNAENLVIFFGATPELIELASDYVAIVLAGSVFLFFAIMSGSMIQAEGNAGTPMKSMVVGATTNMILDPFLIFGIGPFPALGVQGAATATIISQFIACSVNFKYLFFNESHVRPALLTLRLNPYIILDIYKVGFPSMVMQIMNSVIVVILNWILGAYGFIAIGAMGIFFRVQALIFMPIMGLVQGFLPIVGYAYGAKRLDRMKQAIKKASTVAFIIMTIGFLAFQLIPETLVTIFNDDPNLVDIGVECMHYISILLPLVGPAIILSSTFQAVGKGFTAMWLSLLRQVVLLIPFLFILPNYFGLKGVWISFPASDIISIAVTVLVIYLFLNKLETKGFEKVQNTKTITVPKR
ncbi:antimicrobial extrusion protein [Candidatus Syntrophocurvum alkaliphilum]|uniref:Multidrug export protein MepA n=1 Tax=Candidatus Syntrophocurvum alkaliphilum TaxID=2293317 RepID=A0A6I6DGJ9_9FIRM|nr:MATE family efflux transporter [Candidatus Syntrophocurvum alkaliphilum]QGU00118.1 antimicrobial extrusion protein [Candidatus Syntrophocurvum alkaliphilum]